MRAEWWKETYVHGNRDYHQLCVERDQRSVFGQTVIIDKADTNGAKKIPVQSGINQTDENLGGTVPILVDMNESTTDC